MLDKSYRKQSACRNCHFLTIIEEYDEGNTYVCTQDGVKRPKSGSVVMNEGFEEEILDDGTCLVNKDHQYMALFEAWWEYFKEHEVSAHGICDKYKINEIFLRET